MVTDVVTAVVVAVVVAVVGGRLAPGRPGIPTPPEPVCDLARPSPASGRGGVGAGIVAVVVVVGGGPLVVVVVVLVVLTVPVLELELELDDDVTPIPPVLARSASCSISWTTSVWLGICRRRSRIGTAARGSPESTSDRPRS
jgi:hypothetical protein